MALLGGFHLIGCNTPSVRSNMVESVLLAPFGVVLVLPDTCHLPCGTIGARSNVTSGGINGEADQHASN